MIVPAGKAPRRILDPKRRLKMSNTKCPYCFQDFSASAAKNEDHVIGRKFVPSGALAASWNLVVNAHVKCNSDKGRLESQISSITLHQLHFGGNRLFALGEKRFEISLEIRRKGRVRSPVTRRFVAESANEHTMEHRMGPIFFKLGMVSPPQLDPDGVLKLAAMHIRGLCTLVFGGEQGDNLQYLPSNFMLVAEAGRGDWGNARTRAFMDVVRSWPSRLNLSGAARGFFQAMIRKEPSAFPVWAWALEWNRQHRTMGFMGDDLEHLKMLESSLPKPAWSIERAIFDPQHGAGYERYRTETPLRPEEDILFHGDYL